MFDEDSFPLHEAAASGLGRPNTLARALISRDTNVILAALEAGADVGSHPSLGNVTPLQIGVAFCDVAVVRALILHGASLVRFDEHEQTMLGLAVERKRLDVARILLEAGVPPDGVALSDALRRGQVEMARLLFEFGADPDEVLWGIMPLRRFARNNPQLLALFPDPPPKVRVEEPKTNDESLEPDAAIEIVDAAQSGDLDAVKTLLDGGADVNVQTSEGITALMAAVQKNEAEIVKLLLERGANPNLRDENGSHPLYIAVESAHDSRDTRLIQLLLDHGADINSPGESNMPAIAVALRDEALLRFLLERGADPNCITVADVPLLNAAIGQWVPFSMLTLLLEFGANIESADDNGWTPLMQAAMISQKGSGHERDTNLTPHASYLIHLLLGRGADVNARSKSGTVIEHAVEAGDIEIVGQLLDAGADVSYGGNLNAVARAEWKGHADVAMLLRERGAAEPAGNAQHDGIPDDFLLQLRWLYGNYVYADAILDRFNQTRKPKDRGAMPSNYRLNS